MESGITLATKLDSTEFGSKTQQAILTVWTALTPQQQIAIFNQVKAYLAENGLDVDGGNNG